MAEPVPPDAPLRRFFGWILLLVGGLIATLCGLCTAVFFVTGLFGDRSYVVLSLVIGGLPTALGFGLFVAGRSLLRPPPKPPGPKSLD
jgi:hypothetical protein